MRLRKKPLAEANANRNFIEISHDVLPTRTVRCGKDGGHLEGELSENSDNMSQTPANERSVAPHHRRWHRCAL